MVNARNKGQEGERELARLLGGWAAEMGCQLELSRNLVQTREGGYDLNGVPGLAIEVKRVEAPDLNSWWRQAVKQAGAELVPFLAYRPNRKPWRFKVRAPVTMLDQTGAAAGAAMLDIELDEAGGRAWFQHYLFYKGLAKPQGTAT